MFIRIFKITYLRKNFFKYIINNPNLKWAINVLDYYLEKITCKLKYSYKDRKDLWNLGFDSKGYLKISKSELEKTNINSTLKDYERKHFKKFMGLLYCAENEKEDFIQKNLFKIQIYLVFLSVELAMLDV